jgi:hypothetical protein
LSANRKNQRRAQAAENGGRANVMRSILRKLGLFHPIVNTLAGTANH